MNTSSLIDERQILLSGTIATSSYQRHHQLSLTRIIDLPIISWRDLRSLLVGVLGFDDFARSMRSFAPTWR
jgi:hypothetical protein